MKRLITYFLLLILITGCTGRNAGKEKVIVFHAGSLSVPLKKMEREYEILNPGIDIQLEGAGSVACARKITDLKRECDIMASADYKVIDKMLIPDYSDINIRFASNSMALAYSDKSRRSDEINEKNWYEILMDKDVIYGRSDPNSDPCGYRTILTMKLAEAHYGNNDISSVLLAKDVNMIRPKEVDLLALLEVGALDYFFIYTSVALQHNLNYIDLPSEVDLSESVMNDIYSTVSVDINGHSPGEFITITGSEMVYGITLLNNAPNKTEAIKFLRYFLGDKGRSIIEASGQDFIEAPEGVLDKL